MTLSLACAQAKAELAATRETSTTPSSRSPAGDQDMVELAAHAAELQSSLDYERARRKQAEAALEQARVANEDLEDALQQCVCSRSRPRLGSRGGSSPTRVT